MFACHMCTTGHVCAWQLPRPENGIPSSFDLELQMVLSHNVGAGNQTCILWKSIQCSYPMSQVSSPTVWFLDPCRQIQPPYSSAAFLVSQHLPSCLGVGEENVSQVLQSHVIVVKVRRHGHWRRRGLGRSCS